MRKKVDTLILDLDNTIFDWFEIWYANFSPIYAKIVELYEGDTAAALAAIRPIHQKARTSEYTFLIEDLAARDVSPNPIKGRSDFGDALFAAREGRDAKTKLYPTVFQSLWDIKNTGVKVIAYTESLGFYSAYRLKRLGLDGVIDIMFCPEDHDTPSGVSLSQLRNRADESYGLQVTQILHTPKGELKPNVKILREIMNVANVEPSRCAYVGDSLFKDIAMARDAGIFDVYAKYGEAQRRPEYSLLQGVSHWTQEDVERERAINNSKLSFTPSATLHECFAEIFKFCDFVDYTPPGSPDYDADVSETDKINIDIWKKTVDVQQHFNDMGLRIRNFAITIVGALIAAIGVMSQRGLFISFFGFTFPIAVSFVAAAILAWGAFFLMDRFWYHVLLKGAVDHAAKIEEALKNRFPGVALGGTISEKSGAVKIFGFYMSSIRRLNAFYSLGFAMLLIVGIALYMATPSPQLDQPQPSSPTTSKS
jgi:FMN phosphatase YigB (HAD superfamily)